VENQSEKAEAVNVLKNQGLRCYTGARCGVMPMDKCTRYGKIAPLSAARRITGAAQHITLRPEPRMSHHDHPADTAHEPDPTDSRADAIAAFFAIAIAVVGVLYFISQQ
jgi:hypothetical protein